MKCWTYIWRSLVYYRSQHFMLFAGMAVSAAVLTGALIIGDSVRYSLKRHVDIRLGETQQALVSGSRFFETQLANRLEANLEVPVTALLMLKGIIIEPDSGIRINNAFVLGIDSTFNAFCGEPVTLPADDEAVVGKSVADRLGVGVGDELLIRVESTSQVPVNAPFAQEPPPSKAFRKTVIAIAGDDQLGRFTLGNSQSVVFNVFVSQSWLGQEMELAGLSNTILVAGDDHAPSLLKLMEAVNDVWTIEDMGLSVKYPERTDAYDLVSNRIFIDTIIEKSIFRKNLPFQEVITYLVNDITCKGRHVPYSFASALSPGMSQHFLKNHEVIINQWTAEDLDASIGDTIDLTWYEIGPLRQLQEISQQFVVRDIMANISETVNNSLMPAFQGMADAGSCSEWDAGVPIDLKRIRDKDEAYWDTYRGTPKVLLSIETGKKIWQNPFGSLTMLRFNRDTVPEHVLKTLLVKQITPADIGFQAVAVRAEGNRTAEHAVDFTSLFLGMSFFIILTGILLTLLIYTLHTNLRLGETSLLTGIGFTTHQIIGIRLAETSVVILMGSIVGSLLGILYNKMLLIALNTVWNELVGTDMLLLHINPASLLTGTVVSMAIALLPMFYLTTKRQKQPVASLLKGNLRENRAPAIERYNLMRWGIAMLVLSFVLVLISIVLGAINQAALYLPAAFFVLAGGLLITLGRLNQRSLTGKNSVPSFIQLAFTNLQRNPLRSIAVIALLALGTFAVVLTGAYRKTFYGTEQQNSSGTGGYLLWAETTSAVPFDLNSVTEKTRLITDGPDDLNHVRFLQFEALDGDDASCLNLNQVNQPRVLAVRAATFDSARAFTFIKKLKTIEEAHPWLGLNRAINDSTFPAYVDQTVLQYSLQRKLGDTLAYQGENGRPFRLVLAGTLNNTIFQGHIVVADAFFRRFFPSSGGTRVVLVDAPPDKLSVVSGILSRSLVDYGIEVTSTRQRLAAFNSITNTYLSVFMMLSGLGFIMGTIGLGIVLLRNVHERRKELALLLSLGFGRRLVFRLVFTENLFLLLTGWSIGLLAAFIGILPSILSPAFDLQLKFIMLLTSAIFISGLLWIYFPLRLIIHRDLIQTLRND